MKYLEDECEHNWEIQDQLQDNVLMCYCNICEKGSQFFEETNDTSVKLDNSCGL